ncbi:MAG: ATP-binding protein [Chloroflexota bacterium]|nr:ATP-binding protein [Chloroflexota bacterium]
MGFGFLINLLSVLPGTVVYHLLVVLGLLAAAGIVWVEWRQTRNMELRPFVLALIGTMALHFLALLLAPAHTEPASFWARVSAPFLYSVEVASLWLLIWAFGTSLWKKRTVSVLVGLVVVWGTLLAGATLSWYAATAIFPVTYERFWHVPVWYGLSLASGFAGGALLLKHRQQIGGSLLSAAAFFILGMGSLLGLLGAYWIGPILSGGEGAGRLLMLLGYPLFAVAFYQAALHDLQTYRRELQELSRRALRQSEEFLFLLEATRSIGESLGLRGMLGEVVGHVAMALHADRVAILLLSPDKEDILTLVAQYEVLGERYLPPRDVPLGDYPVLRFVLRNRQMVFREHENFKPLRSLFDLLGVEGEGPVLLQPLTRQKRTMGVLVACNDHTGKAFLVEQEQLVATMAVQIAGAVENSNLYREVKAQARKLSRHLKLREEELQRQKAIFESMGEGLLVSDYAGRVILVNKAAEEILEADRESLLGWDVTELLSSSFLEDMLDPALLLSLSSPLQTFLAVGERKVRLHASPVQMMDGARLGVVSILEDVTREYLAEEAKREFITSISHELRTPLTAIKGYSELLLGGMGGAISTPVNAFIGVIRENAVRMSFIVNNLISVAEIERQRVGLKYQKVELPDLVNEVLERYKERIVERKLRLRKELPRDFPAVEIDPNRVRQILENLLSNAIKFTYPGGQVTIGVQKVTGMLNEPAFFSLWVADTGVGIPFEEQGRIWERFYRAANPLSVESGGLGIGLSIAKALTEAHGGRIWVDSMPDKGSTFTVLLPVWQPEIPDGLAET